MRRSSSGAIPSFDMCQVSIAMPPFAAPAPTTTSSTASIEWTLMSRWHQLVDDLRVRVPRRVGAELAEALGQLREGRLPAEDVGDLDVVGVEDAGRLESSARVWSEARRRSSSGSRNQSSRHSTSR